MPFREKSALASFLAILVVYGAYLVLFLRVHLTTGRTHGADLVAAFLGCVVALVILQGVLQVAIALQSPAEARAPQDERERMVDLKATKAAFFTVQAGAVCAMATLHLHADRFVIVNSILAAVVLGELVRSGGQVLLFRRGV